MLLSLHGQSKDALSKTRLGAWEYDVVSPAYKCNMTDVCAAIGLAQMTRYDSMLERRRQIITRYDQALAPAGVTSLRHYEDGSVSSGHLYLANLPGLGEEARNEFIERMAGADVACNVHYKPLPLLSAYRDLGFSIEDFPQAYALYASEVSLPLHTSLTDEQVDYVISCALETLAAMGRLYDWDEVADRYEALARRGVQLRLKRLLDFVGATILMVLLGWLFIILAALIKLDSPGPVFFRQRRVTQFGREFRIVKFRTMTHRPADPGDQITRGNDPRVTKVGAVLRRYRLDEISQLIDILRGTMSFVGTRPEVPEYVQQYTPQMRATLLLPAGVTSTASIEFKDEAEILAAAPPGQDAYLTQVLPAKMRLNLRDVQNFSIGRDLSIALRTVLAVAR